MKSIICISCTFHVSWNTEKSSLFSGVKAMFMFWAGQGGAAAGCGWWPRLYWPCPHHAHITLWIINHFPLPINAQECFPVPCISFLFFIIQWINAPMEEEKISIQCEQSYMRAADSRWEVWVCHQVGFCPPRGVFIDCFIQEGYWRYAQTLFICKLNFINKAAFSQWKMLGKLQWGAKKLWVQNKLVKGFEMMHCIDLSLKFLELINLILST